MPYCKKCGVKLENDSIFCHICGTPVKTESKEEASISGREEINNKSSLMIPEMVYVKGGVFNMGSESSSDDQKPIHWVTVDDFYIGKYEVTQKEWKAIMGDSSSHFSEEKKPVSEINWYDAVNYCNKLSEAEGLEKFYNIDGENVTMNWGAKGYRLPTEAEWEYAARGGKESLGYEYSGSNNVDEVAWHGWECNWEIMDVGKKLPNELGIYDMTGNVWEWCNDWYGEDYYKKSPSRNPKGPKSGSNRVLRGGTWDDGAYSCRSTDRYRINPGYSYVNGIGFRISRTP